MASYYGYVVIAHDNYLQWKTAVLGNNYDADGSYGFQCWDLAAEFWYNVGFAQGYPHTGTNHYVSECWSEKRVENAGSSFTLITDYQSIKQGDVVVLDGDSTSPTGHIAFADEDFSTVAGLPLLGQNQGTTSVVNITTVSLANFLGAFRLNAWHPTPSTQRSRRLVTLSTRKLRAKRQNVAH